MRRFRSSSRCSRKDILLPDSSTESGSSSSPGVALGKGTSAMTTLRAAVLARDGSVAVVGARSGRGRGVVVIDELGDLGRLLAFRRLAFFQADFLVERVLQLVRRALELGETLAEGLAQFRQLARPENDEGNGEDDDELWEADRTEHDARNYTPRRLLRCD